MTFVLAQASRDKPVYREWRFEDGQGVFAVKTQFDLNEPQIFSIPVPIILKSRLQEGGAWGYNASIRKGRFSSRVESLGLQKVGVRAGEFDAFVLNITNTIESENEVTRTEVLEWHAAGIGLIKRETQAKEGKTILELVGYKLD